MSGLSEGDRAWLASFFADITARFNSVEAAIGEANHKLTILQGEVSDVHRDLVDHAARTGHRGERDEETIDTLVRRERSGSR